MMDNETIATLPDILGGGGRGGGGRPLVPGSMETRGTVRATRDHGSDTAAGVADAPLRERRTGGGAEDVQ